jgi:hypothetical protein
MTTLTDDEVLSRAEKWARFHKKENLRGRMDEALQGISQADQRRVYLCGMRISGGLPPKVLPATNKAKAEPPAKQAEPPQKKGMNHENKKKPVAKTANRKRA